MEITIIFGVLLGLSVIFYFSARQSASKARTLYRDQAQKATLLEEKLNEARKELSVAKEDSRRNKAALADAKELTRKKFRVQAQKANEGITAMNKSDTLSPMSDENSQTLKALETQLRTQKEDSQRAFDELNAKREAEFSEKTKKYEQDLQEAAQKIELLQSDIKKQKRMLRGGVPKVNIETLPDETVAEFARLARKADQHERLHGIARAKLQMAQEKFAELQKRYFAVCRELAVLAGKPADAPEGEARDLAEAVISSAERMVPESKTTNCENGADHKNT